MKPSTTFLVCALLVSAVSADDAAIYDADIGHPWNRLSLALHTTAPLRFDPPGAYEARVLTGDAYEAARKALDDFVVHDRAKAISDPTRRALLQSELWATFDQVSDATGESQPARRDIARRCATLIKRLALSSSQIAALPDTYARTLALRTFPTGYDAEHPDAPFLPVDLLDERGPWVMLGAGGSDLLKPAAIQHVKATQGRSVFYALVRLPEGRPATLAYLKRLADFPEPYVANEMHARYPYARAAMKLNPALPQFPAGTQVALVRRMILVASDGEPVVSPIVEGIQLRVYERDPLTAQPGDLVNQRFFEFALDPQALRANTGGLRATERTPPSRRLLFAQATLFSQGSCNDCHGAVGVMSLNTYVHAFGPLPDTPWFEASSVRWQNTHTLNWKKRDYTWGLLSGLDR